MPFLQNHILPEFKSPVPYLRARACWVIEHFSELDWEAEANTEEGNAKGKKSKRIVKGGKGKNNKNQQQMTAGEILRAVLQGLIESLRDPALPVQAAAACALQ
jgi:hypothetical protein